jgi:hypothetical protein
VSVPTVPRRLLTLLLCISLMPGWTELLENLEHLAHDGHLAHLVGHDEGEDVAGHEALEAEHGCTPVRHTCGCHTSVPVILPDAPPDLVAMRVVALRQRPLPRHDTPIHRATAPPLPPPRTRATPQS